MKNKLITTHEELKKLHGRRVEFDYEYERCLGSIGVHSLNEVKIKFADHEFITELWISNSKMHYEDLSENNSVTNIRLIDEPKTLDNLEEGDVVEARKGGRNRTVLGICGQVVFLSDCTGLRDYVSLTKTISYLKEYGYTVKQPLDVVEPLITELTLQQVADKFGIDVKELRIKDDDK